MAGSYRSFELPQSRERRKKREAKERRVRALLLLAVLALIVGGAFAIWSYVRSRWQWGAESAVTKQLEESSEEGNVSFLGPTATMTPSATATRPTATPTNTLTPTPTLTPTVTLSPTPRVRPKITVEGGPPDPIAVAEMTQEAYHQAILTGTEVPQQWFELSGNPTAFDGSLIYENADCTWMGVAGVLIDRRGEPQIGYYVQIGYSDGRQLETLSGLYPNYGESGYELTIARPVQNFESPLWIRVLNSERVPVSEKFYFRPSSQCERSLTVINYLRIR